MDKKEILRIPKAWWERVCNNGGICPDLDLEVEKIKPWTTVSWCTHYNNKGMHCCVRDCPRLVLFD